MFAHILALPPVVLALRCIVQTQEVFVFSFNVLLLQHSKKRLIRYPYARVVLESDRGKRNCFCCCADWKKTNKFVPPSNSVGGEVRIERTNERTLSGRVARRNGTAGPLLRLLRWKNTQYRPWRRNSAGCPRVMRWTDQLNVGNGPTG
jgi:hypothetical protein